VPPCTSGTRHFQNESAPITPASGLFIDCVGLLARVLRGEGLRGA
jgi:hypothetical protein